MSPDCSAPCPTKKNARRLTIPPAQASFCRLLAHLCQHRKMDKRLPAYAQADWPQDPDKLREIYNERMENMTDEERAQLLEAIRRLPPAQRDSIIKNNTASANFARQIKEPDYGDGPVDPAELREYEKQVKERLALIRAQKQGEKGKRTYLTQPPERFTDVTPEVASQMEQLKQQENKGKKKRFFSRIWPFGKKDSDSDS